MSNPFAIQSAEGGEGHYVTLLDRFDFFVQWQITLCVLFDAKTILVERIVMV